MWERMKQIPIQVEIFGYEHFYNVSHSEIVFFWI